MSRKQPVIIIGMHRSGTSMLIRMLGRLGLFIGHNLDSNAEAVFFQRLNDWFLKQGRSSWHNPENFRHAPAYFHSLMADIAERRLKSFHRAKYLGLAKSFKYSSIKNIDFDWGWKDPRNTITLDIWLKLFPDAKVIHIYRHPVDVISSMCTREFNTGITVRDNPTRTGLKKLIRAYRLPRRQLYIQPFRVFDYDGVFSMWKEYVSLALARTEQLSDRMINICYEDFLLNPTEILKAAAEHAGLQTDDTKIDQIVRHIKIERRFAFLKNDELGEYYSLIKNDPLLVKLEYEKL